MNTNIPAGEYERFWTELKRDSEKLANEKVGIVIETGQPINGGALSVAYRVTKPGHGYPLGKVIVTVGPGERRDVLVVEELRWKSNSEQTKYEKKIEIRFDQSAQRFFLHASDGNEIGENEAPHFFLACARAIFDELLMPLV